MHLNVLAKHMRTAGDENRLRIICYLFKEEDSCVSDIATHLQLSVATTSHHLKMMEKDGLVEARRDGKHIFYSVPTTPFVNGLKKFICTYTKI